MKDTQGAIREFITALAGLFATLNFFPSTSIDTVAGLAVAGVLLVMGFVMNQGREQIFSLVRKFISLLPAALIHFQVVNPDVGAQMTVALVPMISIAWSLLFKGKDLPPSQL